MQERAGTTEADDFLVPPRLNWPMWMLIYLKAGMMLVAYIVFIIPFLASKVGA
jgi:hypothetical protein